jgi:hypothetical protein
MAETRLTSRVVSEIPTEAGAIVSMVVHQGKILLAFDYAVYELIEAAYPQPAVLREILAIDHWGAQDHG